MPEAVKFSKTNTNTAARSINPLADDITGPIIQNTGLDDSQTSPNNQGPNNQGIGINRAVDALSQAIQEKQVERRQASIIDNEATTTKQSQEIATVYQSTLSGGTSGHVLEDGPAITGTLVLDDNLGTTFNMANGPTSNNYGTFNINAAGVWTYTLDNTNSIIQALAVGSTLNDNFTISTSDGTTQTIAVTITGTNDRPLLNSINTSDFTGIHEDASSSSSETLVSTLLGNSITDIDNSQFGIAITGLSGTGTWEYSTNANAMTPTWQTIGTVTANAARVLFSNADTKVRYMPAADENGTVQLTYKAWDRSGSETNGTASVNTTTGTAFSSNTTNADLVITAVNDAPALDNTGNMNLTAINEDVNNSAGDTVANIVSSAMGDRITDPDASPLEGMAITSIDNTNGDWQYSTDNGSSWVTLPSVVSDAHTILLTPTDKLRFLPNSDFHGTANFSFRAWDQTASHMGLTNNTAATIATTGTTGTVSEDGTLTASGTLTITSEPDSNENSFTPIANLQGAYGSLTIDSAGAWTYSLDNANTTVQAIPLNGTLTDTLTVTSIDGTTRDISITINGDNDFNTVATNTTVTQSSNEYTLTTTSPIEQRAAIWEPLDISLPFTLSVDLYFGVTNNGAHGITFGIQNDGNNLVANAGSVGSSLGNQGAIPSAFGFLIDTSGVETSRFYTEGRTNEHTNPATADGSSANGSRQIHSGLKDGTWHPVTITWDPTTHTLTYNIDNGTTHTTVYDVVTNDFGGSTSNVFYGFTASTGARTNEQKVRVSAFQYTDSDSSSSVLSDHVPGDIANTLGSTHPFSSASETVSITVNPINDAPILTPANTANFANITEDAAASASETLISTLIGTGIDDSADSNTTVGIAITGLSGSGTWEYSTNASAMTPTWQTIGTVTANAARVLFSDADTKVRYTPTADENGTVQLTYKAWDRSTTQSNGTASVDTTTGTAFSTNTTNADLVITAVNDAPVLTSANTVNFANINEDAAASASETLISTLIGTGIDDSADSNTTVGIAITGLSGSGTWEYSTNASAMTPTWQTIGTVTANAARVLFSDADTKVRYTPTADENGTVQLTYKAWDRSTTQSQRHSVCRYQHRHSI